MSSHFSASRQNSGVEKRYGRKVPGLLGCGRRRGLSLVVSEGIKGAHKGNI